jgi:hypothetical protein
MNAYTAVVGGLLRDVTIRFSAGSPLRAGAMGSASYLVQLST